MHQQSKNKIIGIYHKNCVDGTTAAAVFLKKFPQAKAFPLQHGYSTEDRDLVLKTVNSDSEVYILDGCFLSEELLSKAKKITIIDHHIGVKEDLDKLAKDHKNLSYIFDNNYSGASLAWKYFFPDEPLPYFIKLVEDQDLSIFQYGEDTESIALYASMFCNEPEKFLSYFYQDISGILSQGKIILKYRNNLIDYFTLNIKPVLLKINNYQVKAYNCSNSNNFKNKIGYYFSKKHNEAVAVFYFNGQEVYFNFRSYDGQFPSALDLAKAIGGGGHHNKSGACIPLKKFIEMLVIENE